GGVPTRCPLYPRKRTWISTVVMSAKGQKQTSACLVVSLKQKAPDDAGVLSYSMLVSFNIWRRPGRQSRRKYSSHGQDYVHVLTDVMEERSAAKKWGDGQRYVPRAHEQVIVFDSNRPARGEAELDAHSGSATPTGFRPVGKQEADRAIDQNPGANYAV